MNDKFVTIVVKNPTKPLSFDVAEKLLGESVSAIGLGDSMSNEEKLQAQLDEAKELLKAAKCPQCDGSGAYYDCSAGGVGIECCGEFLPHGECCGNGRPSDPEPVFIQCQFCHERNRLNPQAKEEEL